MSNEISMASLSLKTLVVIYYDLYLSAGTKKLTAKRAS